MGTNTSTDQVLSWLAQEGDRIKGFKARFVFDTQQETQESSNEMSEKQTTDSNEAEAVAILRELDKLGALRGTGLTSRVDALFSKSAGAATIQEPVGSMPDCWVVVKDGCIIGTHDAPGHLHGIQAVRYVPAQQVHEAQEPRR
jgi:hypothetical protein